MLFFAPPPPPPVSYNRDVAPILAMRCNGCHGEAGRFSTRAHSALMAGGNLGPVVIPGDAENSLLTHFIEGRRGEARRMPIGGRPLNAGEIQTIRRWIDEGAHADATLPPNRVKRLDNVRLPRDDVLHVSCLVKTDAYLTLALRDPRTQRVLLTRVASVKSDREDGDAGRPGEPIVWDLRPERGWPVRIDVELTVEYAAGGAGDAELAAQAIKSSSLSNSK